MADDSGVVVDDDENNIVTKFIFNTCGLLQPTMHRVVIAAACAGLASIFVRNSPHDDVRTCVDDEVVHLIPLITGSSDEFYIQPMMPYVGDVDVMVHRSDQLAIPDGYPPPSRLPAEFHSRVAAYEIVDSEYPGYVYLSWAYFLTEDSNTGRYDAVRYDDRHFVYHVSNYVGQGGIHGPAYTIDLHHADANRPLDAVFCMRCLSWPPQAADWPTRHRNYDWPDSATVDHVVNNGCDVVYVAHCQCRQDKWISMYQSRLSFSRAEIVLLNSWMPVHQIVYHMLRFFIKTQQLTDNKDSSGTKIFSNYHIKTLTMWACEVKPQKWWTDDMNLVTICVRLFHIFADWLKKKFCPHYFVNNCNLFYDTEQSEIIASHFMSITESWLSMWFVSNYLRKCAQLCPDRVLRLFDDLSMSTNLQNVVSAVVDWRLNRAQYDLCRVWLEAEYHVSCDIPVFSLTVRSCGVWINELAKIDPCLCDYFTAVAFLHVSNRIAKHSLSDELMDVLATVLGQFVGKRRYCHQLSSELSLSQAVILMKVVVANNSRSTLHQIEFELSKAYLYRALRCKDSDSDSIYCLSNVYLAFLYYSSRQFQTTIDHCTLVMRSQDHSQCSSHVIQGDVLPKVDDHIDTVLGLAVFYQYVRTAALNQQQTQYVSVFTTELFAHYLYIRCLSVMKCCQFTQMLSTDEVQRHTKYIIDNDRLFIADVLLLQSVKTLQELNCRYKSLSQQHQYLAINASERETTELDELLEQSAVEHLTTFRHLETKQFGSIVTIVTTDFEALYTYKRGDYHQCLQLSTQNVHTLMYADDMPYIWTHPEFVQLMDDDIVSLTVLTLILDPGCRYGSKERTRNICIYQLPLSLYVMTQCQLKLHHSATSLAQTLHYIEVAQRRTPLDYLVLKLAERKVMIYLRNSVQS